MARTDLGKIFITNGGEYDPNTVYEEKTFVLFQNSTYLALQTVTGVEPTDDRVNWQLMAKGFADDEFSIVKYLYAGSKDAEDEMDEEGNVVYEGTPQIPADSLGGHLPEYYAPQHEISYAFSVEKNYVVGDYCIYMNNLYRFTVEKSAGEWDGTKVVPVMIDQELKRLSGEVSTLNTNMGNYYALSGGTRISAGSDLDNYKDPGSYYCLMSADALSIVNRPFDMAFTMKTEYSNGLSYPRQTVVSINATKQCMRWFDTGASKWSDWSYYEPVSNHSFIRISGAGGDTFKKALTGRSNLVTFLAFNNNPSDNPFSFSTGYAIALQDHALTVPTKFNMIGINHSNSEMQGVVFNL